MEGSGRGCDRSLTTLFVTFKFAVTPPSLISIMPSELLSRIVLPVISTSTGLVTVPLPGTRNSQ